MISELYADIQNSFNNRDYYRVIKLIEKAIKIPGFGFDRSLLYEYGYALLRTSQIKKGISIFRIITKLDSNPGMLKQAEKYIKNWEEQQAIKLPIEDYLRAGHELKEGLVVYLDTFQDFECDTLAQENIIKFPFMIWKIENNRVYAFPVRRRYNHGYYLRGTRYFKECDLTVKPNLVSFNLSSISRIDMQLDTIDYNRTIQDIYERMCVFGTRANTPKNCFVTEIEKNLSIAVGDIITIFDPNNKYRNYYCIVGIDEENQVYKGVKITHNNGEITLKDENIYEIPFSSYIMEKIAVSSENIERIMEASLKIEESLIKR